MPETKVHDDALLDRLSGVFRRAGYDGASLSMLAEAAGLQRASLYHRFPGGKAEMAEAVLGRVDAWFVEHVFATLSTDAPPANRLKRMVDALAGFYDGGSMPCLIDTMAVGEGGDLFATHLAATAQRWIDELARLIRGATGLTKAKARARAEAAVVAIEGALVISRATGDPRPFRRTLREMRSTLLTT